MDNTPISTRQMKILSLYVLLAALLSAQGRNYGRSMVITQQGVVATSQALASEAGAEILARGGSAVDAAIAANAVLAATEPMMDGPGETCSASTGMRVPASSQA